MDLSPLQAQARAWAALADALSRDPNFARERDRSRHFQAVTLGVVHGSRTRQASRALLSEGIRICARAIRQHYSLIANFERALVDSVAEGARGSIELVFQVMFLLRSPDPDAAALDAINFSAMRWASGGDRLVQAGELPASAASPKGSKARALVEAQVFTKYGKRTPRFFLDMSAKDTANRAGLQRLYDLTYGPLSMALHSTPMAELDAILRRTSGGLELAAIPSADLIGKMAAAFSVGSQCAVVAALGGLSLAAEIDVALLKPLCDQFSEAYSGEFARELQTIAERFGTTWTPPTR